MAITSQVQSEAAGIPNHAMGTFVTDAGAAVAVTLAPGFRPRRFKLTNVTNFSEYEWQVGMPAGAVIQTVAAGTRTAPTNTGIAVSTAQPTDGVITIPAAIAVASSTFVWEAIG